MVCGFIDRRYFRSIAVVLCTLTFFVIWFNASLLIRQKKGPIDNIDSEKLTSDVIDLTQNEIQKRSPDAMTTQKMSQNVSTTQKRSPDMMTTQEMSSDAITEQMKSPDAKASFVAGEPKQLLILAYQRTGSSFFGQIFNNDPDAFYVFEPLDGLYNSIYGTRHGWAVPTDIYHFPDGSPRTPPDFEVEAVVSTLRHFFSCDVAELPVGLLTHRFFKQFPLYCTESYRKCLRWHNLYKQCSHKLHRRCLVRFGSDKKTIDMCRIQINRVDTSAAGILSYVVSHNVCHNVSTPVTTTSVDTKVYNEALKLVNELVEIDSHHKSQKTKKDIRKTTEDQIEESEFHISDYVRCLKTKARKLLKCLPNITHSCTSSNLRVIKLVRGEMRDVDALMRASRNFRLVHLIRDPRGVINSRRKLSSYRSISVNKNNMEPEAYYYCADVMRDIRLRRQLEAKYPGRTLQVIYDDFVTNAQKQVRQIYESLLERPLPAAVAAFTKWTRPSIASSWKAKLNETVVQQIDTACKGLYEMLSERGNIFNHEHEMG